MTFKPTTVFLTIFFVGLLFLLPSRFIAQQLTTAKTNNVDPKLASELAAIAEESISAQNEVLVTGDLSNVLSTKTNARRYGTAMQKKFSDQIETRNLLKSKRQDYKSFETKFALGDVWSEGSKIILVVTEQTKFKLEVPGGPEFTEYAQDYIFEFSKNREEWVITKATEVPIGFPTPTEKNHDLPGPSAVKPSILEVPSESPTTYAPPGYKPSAMLHKKPAFEIGPLFVKASYAPSGTYNATAAVNYARTYALYPNPAFGIFDNDCTNFMSQCVSSGGWSQVGYDDRANSSYGIVNLTSTDKNRLYQIRRNS